MDATLEDRVTVSHRDELPAFLTELVEIALEERPGNLFEISRFVFPDFHRRSVKRLVG